MLIPGWPRWRRVALLGLASIAPGCATPVYSDSYEIEGGRWVYAERAWHVSREEAGEWKSKFAARNTGFREIGIDWNAWETGIAPPVEGVGPLRETFSQCR